MIGLGDSNNSNDNKSEDNEIVSDKTTVLETTRSTSNLELQKAKEQEACFIIIRGTPQGHRFFLTQSEMIIGRDLSAEISIADQGISRKHAKVIKKDGKVTIIDLGSSNGTAINDKKINPGDAALLEKEDMIKVGSTILKFLPAGEIEILFYGNLGSAAHTDPLTRIYNKGYLLEAMESEVKRAKALHANFSVIFFDLDHFKRINDTFGHDAGDFVLKEVTSLIQNSHIRPRDIFARYGGEEFVILLFNTNSKLATEIAERIRTAIESHNFNYEGKRLPVSISAGVSELRPGVDTPQTLLKDADKGLYTAKHQGRNRVITSEN